MEASVCRGKVDAETATTWRLLHHSRGVAVETATTWETPLPFIWPAGSNKTMNFRIVFSL